MLEKDRLIVLEKERKHQEEKNNKIKDMNIIPYQIEIARG